MKRLEIILANNQKVILFSVPDDAKNFTINNSGCIRYDHNMGRQNSPILPETLQFYAEKEICEILGTYDSKLLFVNFEPEDSYVESSNGYYKDYLLKDNNFTLPKYLSFISLISSEVNKRYGEINDKFVIVLLK